MLINIGPIYFLYLYNRRTLSVLLKSSDARIIVYTIIGKVIKHILTCIFNVVKFDLIIFY